MHASGSCGTGGKPNIEAVRAIVEGSEVTLDGKEPQRWLYGGCRLHRMGWIVYRPQQIPKEDIRIIEGQTDR